MPVLLTFGDSNTHGTPPLRTLGEYRRYDAATRWPTRAAAALGPGWTLVEEGLPGRTAQFDDPVMGAHMNGQTGLQIALHSHGPIDVLTLMLGTNDVKARFATMPEQVTAGLAGLLDLATGPEVQARHAGFRILLVCPPPVLEQGLLAPQFAGAAARARGLPTTYAALARAHGCGFLDAGRIIAVSPIDGVHFDEPAHATLADAVADAVRGLA